MSIFFSELKFFWRNYSKKRKKYKLVICESGNDKWNVYTRGMDEILFLTLNDKKKTKVMTELEKLKDYLVKVKGEK